MRVLILALLLLPGCGGKRLVWTDALAENLPEEIIEICVIGEPEESVDCYDFSTKTQKRVGDEPTRIIPSVDELEPGYYLPPESLAGYRRVVRFFVPESEVWFLQKKYDIPDSLIKHYLTERIR